MKILDMPPRFGALMLVLGVLVAGCVVEEGPPSGPGPIRPLPPDRPYACSRQYDPVCAAQGGDRRTFANACQAERAGFRILRGGECRGAPAPAPVGFCTQQYDPVCARRGSTVRTFGNSCEAENAGYRIVSGGPCRSQPVGGPGPGGPVYGPGPGGPGYGPGPAPQEPRFCTREYRPVCARRGGGVRTFPNPCEADSAGFRVVADGPC